MAGARTSTVAIVSGACAAMGLVAALGAAPRQAPAAAPVNGQAPARGAAPRGGGGGIGASIFAAADTNKDGAATRGELMTALETWLAAADTGKTGSVTPDAFAAVLNAAFPAPAPPQATGRAAGQPTEPKPQDVTEMLAALPATAPARPQKPRKVLVLAKAQGFVHSSIPLAARTVEALGTKTKAWTTTITYDPADITTANLQQYDAIFLDSTTGCFLDAPGDPAATAARRAALLAFVRGGKGLAGIHAASDSYHSPCPNDPQPAGRGRGAVGPGAQLAQQIVAQADKNNDRLITTAEISALGNVWFDEMDRANTGRISQADFTTRFAAVSAPPVGRGGPGQNGAPGGAPAVARGSGPQQKGSWPEFNTMIGGFFKFHWVDPQLITVKIDDPKSPLTKMFAGKEFEIHDETYTYAQDSFSRTNVHVLTSIDYDKMSPEDKAKEPASDARTDGDYALSWIRTEGKGRVFYEAHGHNERIYKITPMLQHVLAGIQYALGDLKADATPSAAPAGRASTKR